MFILKAWFCVNELDAIGVLLTRFVCRLLLKVIEID
jgi:hypothetical protein